MKKDILFGKTKTELQAIVDTLNMPKYAAMQLCEWMYQKNATSIYEMTNLSQKHRNLLDEHFELGLIKPVEVQISIDGTKKYLYPVSDNYFIESVYIPDKDRATLCVSSQVGCKMGCRFCMTARQGFKKNLTVNEILNQIQSLPEKQTLTNIVFMGMGEPLDNYENVKKSLEILTDSDWGSGMSPRRITVSSIGIIHELEHLINETQCHIAISLHSPFHEERMTLVPAENKYPIKNIIQEIRKYNWEGQRRISFEYTMFQGVNDTVKHAKALVALLKGIVCRINLIRFHAIPDSPLQGSSEASMVVFRDILTQSGITSTIRASRGEDIFAACGLLSTSKMNL